MLFLVAGCGGGGTDEPADPTPSASSTDAAPLPDPMASDAPPDETLQDPSRSEALATTPATTTATCGLPNFQAAALARINQYRAAGASCRTAGTFAPTQPLVWNAKLLQAAAGHSQDMATRNYFSHTSLDGRTMVQRINATGYLWSTVGENIAAGQPTVNAVVDGWMASDGHCRNLMNPNFKDVGLACVASSTSRYRTYWTMDLGRPR